MFHPRRQRQILPPMKTNQAIRRTAWGILTILVPLLTAMLLLLFSNQVRTAAAGPSASNPVLPDGTFVMRVYYDRLSDIDRLSQYDVWEFNDRAERYVLLSGNRAIFNQLTAQGWRVEVDQPRSAIIRRPESANLFSTGYRTVDELYADMARITSAYPGLTEMVDYGDSFCKTVAGCMTPGGDKLSGFDLFAIRVTNESIAGSSTLSASVLISGTKPVFFLLANIHAREITTPELAMRFLDWLVEGYGLDANATWLVDWHELWIVPTANPDGHWLVELGERPPYNSAPFFQRKNADDRHGCATWVPTPYNQYGVDLNRNHSYAWGGSGTSTDPCSQNFRGPSAGSEPEIAQLQNLVRSLIPDQRGATPTDPAPDDTGGIFITTHSFSELVLWPWGYTSLPAPNRTGLKAIGDRMAAFNGYTSCQPGNCLYHASGTSDDWVYGELGVPAFTFEVGTQFMPPYDEIDATQWPENAPAFRYAATIARAPYQLVRGPDVVSISTSQQADTLVLSAEVDDRLNGAQPIATAVFTVDTPYWVSGAISYTLAATDASYDTASETVSAMLDTASLSPGRHTLFIRGMDNNGNWGPVNSLFFSVRRRSLYFPIAMRD